MPYEVNLDVYQGPIDLLLHLITRQRVDIYEVSLATITEEYVATVTAMPELDLETATSFLVVAAALLELKSSRLLPAPSAEAASLLEERDLLLARLVECATYRDAGSWLAVALEAGSLLHPREAGLEPHLAALSPPLRLSLRPEDVAHAAAAALMPRPEPELDTSHITPITASVRDAIADIAGRLAASGTAAFAALCPPEARRIDVVVRFLGLLELFKAGVVDLYQGERFGDITATWVGGSIDDVMIDVEEYGPLEASLDRASTPRGAGRAP